MRIMGWNFQQIDNQVLAIGCLKNIKYFHKHNALKINILIQTMIRIIRYCYQETRKQ
jgi:hypothetical protein